VESRIVLRAAAFRRDLSSIPLRAARESNHQPIEIP